MRLRSFLAARRTPQGHVVCAGRVSVAWTCCLNGGLAEGVRLRFAGPENMQAVRYEKDKNAFHVSGFHLRLTQNICALLLWSLSF